MATDRWSWKPAEWARIEKIAREHRKFRADAKVYNVHGTVMRLAVRAVVRGTALELRQWARVARMVER